MKGCSRLYCLDSGDILITSFASILAQHIQFHDFNDGILMAIRINLLAVPRIFSPKWLDMWPPWQECFHTHFKTWKKLETVSIDRENPSIIDYFKTTPISLKTSTQFFVPDEKTLEALVCADALATSRQALVKIWIARV